MISNTSSVLDNSFPHLVILQRSWNLTRRPQFQIPSPTSCSFCHTLSSETVDWSLSNGQFFWTNVLLPFDLHDTFPVRMKVLIKKFFRMLNCYFLSKLSRVFTLLFWHMINPINRQKTPLSTNLHIITDIQMVTSCWSTQYNNLTLRQGR